MCLTAFYPSSSQKNKSQAGYLGNIFQIEMIGVVLLFPPHHFTILPDCWCHCCDHYETSQIPLLKLHLFILKAYPKFSGFAVWRYLLCTVSREYSFSQYSFNSFSVPWGTSKIGLFGAIVCVPFASPVWSVFIVCWFLCNFYINAVHVIRGYNVTLGFILVELKR